MLKIIGKSNAPSRLASNNSGKASPAVHSPYSIPCHTTPKPLLCPDPTSQQSTIRQPLDPNTSFPRNPSPIHSHSHSTSTSNHHKNQLITAQTKHTRTEHDPSPPHQSVTSQNRTECRTSSGSDVDVERQTACATRGVCICQTGRQVRQNLEPQARLRESRHWGRNSNKVSAEETRQSLSF